MYRYNQEKCYFGKSVFCPWSDFDDEVNHIIRSIFKDSGIEFVNTKRDGVEWHIAIYADLKDLEAMERARKQFYELYKRFGTETDAESDWAEQVVDESNDDLYVVHICPEVSEGIISEYYLDFPIAFSMASEQGIMFAEKVQLQRKEFAVDTPDGRLIAHACGDEEYPGISIELLRKDGNVTLAMVEYIPGGEGVADYDPENPARMREQIDSIPKQRIMHQDGSPLTANDYVAATLNSLKEYRVTAGLVTRTWPNEADNMEYHRDTYHTGYKNTNNNKEEK